MRSRTHGRGAGRRFWSLETFGQVWSRGPSMSSESPETAGLSHPR